MRIRRRKAWKIHEGDLTPMIDMTFQLIAFFMVLINFSQTERTDEIQLPDSILAKPPEVRPEYQIVLNLDRKEDGGVRVLIAGRTIEEIKLMKPFLEREVEYAGRQDIGPAEIQVIIRSHKDNPMGKVQELIKKCQESNLESFVFRVKEKI